MAQIIRISSLNEFNSVLQSHAVVVVDFYADWCQPCHQIAPFYEQLSKQLARPNKIAFTKVNTDEQKQITQSYNISAMPTFLVIKNGRETNRVTGADPKKLSEAVKAIAAAAESSDAEASGNASRSSQWRGADIPRGYGDITDQVDQKDLDVLNLDSSYGNAKVLFDPNAPSALDTKGKGKEKAADGKKDWVESDTDEQLMIYVPFQSTLKVHSLHLTSLPPADSDEDETPLRPKQIHLYTNRAHNLGFEEADGVQPTQVLELSSKDWNEQTGTANLALRFVKFQNVSSLVIFVVSGDGDGEKVRIDRVRLVGETGEKRAMGKLEKIGGEDG